MNILFVMKHRGNAGNTHAVADYMRVAPKFGHHVAIFGPTLPWLPEINFSDQVRGFDKAVYLFESEIYRLSPVRETMLIGGIARKDRMILDMDGMYNPVVCLDGYDRNHDTEEERAAWIEHYHALADRVHKPTLAPPATPRDVPLTFYGYDPALETDPKTAPEKIYDILHVGHHQAVARQSLTVGDDFEIEATNDPLSVSARRARNRFENGFDLAGNLFHGRKILTNHLDAHGRANAGRQHVNARLDRHRPGIGDAREQQRLVHLLDE